MVIYPYKLMVLKATSQLQTSTGPTAPGLAADPPKPSGPGDKRPSVPKKGRGLGVIDCHGS